ncbi:MAG: NAD(P)H-dependent oxidoreductase [Nitriliruptoraceae bacterium]
MTTPLTIAVVLASTNPEGAGVRIARWFEDRAGALTDAKLDPVRVDADPAVFRQVIAAADAVVVITPEYNHSFPGPLKTAIDELREEWFATPVGFITYGGISGGLRAAEALRVVFGELHTVTIRETISFTDASAAFGSDGEPTDRVGPDAAATRFLEVLLWWARALRQATEITPYPA